MASAQATVQKKCPFFWGGRCKFGNRCKFSHVRPPPFDQVNEPMYSASEKSLEKPTQASVCRYWKNGCCSRGGHCRFLHREPSNSSDTNTPQTSGGVSPETATATSSITRNFKQKPQFSSPNGNNRPARSKVTHVKRTLQAAEKEANSVEFGRQQLKYLAKVDKAVHSTKDKFQNYDKGKGRQDADEPSSSRSQEAAFTSQHRVLGSTVITVGCGLDIRHILCGFETFQIKIKRLPLDVQHHEIMELFTHQGITSESVFLDKIYTKRGHQEAIVLTDRKQGFSMAAGLKKTMLRNKKVYMEFDEDSVAADAMEKSPVSDCNILTISWRAPSITMSATYETAEIACEKARTLNNTIFLGRKIMVKMHKPATRKTKRHFGSSSIKIFGLPEVAQPLQVSNFVGTQYIKALKPAQYFLEDLLVRLRGHLMEIDGFQDFVHNQLENGFVTGKARFKFWEQAETARDSLDGVRLRPGYPRFKFFVPKPLQYFSIITSRQYRAQKDLWDSIPKRTESTVAQVLIQSRRNTVLIKVTGEDEKSVGALKVRVESLTAGEKLHSKYWHSSISSEKGKGILDRIYSETGAFLRCDWKTKSLRLYGDVEQKQKARQMIEAEISRLERQEWTIHMKEHTVNFVVSKGLTALKELSGVEVLKLDLKSNPCKLTLCGSENARHALDFVLQQALCDPNLLLPSASSEEIICHICYDAVSNPIQLGCGHFYCTSCFRHYLTSTMESKVFPIVCLGDKARCRDPIPIPMIQRFLAPQQFTDLIHLAFLVYLDHHPEQFRYCITPDCTQIYRCNGENMLKCPSCFVKICPSCRNQAHIGMTCKERDQEQETLNYNFAIKQGFKKCPSCQVWIEKLPGCNHITCRCGIHFCWKCEGIFSNEEILTHVLGVPDVENIAELQRLEIVRFEQVVVDNGPFFWGMDQRRVEAREAARVLHEHQRRAEYRRNRERRFRDRRVR